MSNSNSYSMDLPTIQMIKDAYHCTYIIEREIEELEVLEYKTKYEVQKLNELYQELTKVVKYKNRLKKERNEGLKKSVK